MKIRVISDIHLEHMLAINQGSITWVEEYIQQAGTIQEEILIIAGDLGNATMNQNKQQIYNVLQTLHQHWDDIVYVPGNHETYGCLILCLEELD